MSRNGFALWCRLGPRLRSFILRWAARSGPLPPLSSFDCGAGRAPSEPTWITKRCRAVHQRDHLRYSTMATTYMPKNMHEVRLCLSLPHFASRIADSVVVRVSPGVQLPARVRTVGD